MFTVSSICTSTPIDDSDNALEHAMDVAELLLVWINVQHRKSITECVFIHQWAEGVRDLVPCGYW